jgi:hypothetical protein
VLKLVVMSKNTTPATEPVIHAFRSALVRLEALAAQTNDPVDNQLFSACKELLASQDAAAGKKEVRA